MNKHILDGRTKIWELGIDMYKCNNGFLMSVRYQKSILLEGKIEKMFDVFDKITDKVLANNNENFGEIFSDL